MVIAARVEEGRSLGLDASLAFAGQKPANVTASYILIDLPPKSGFRINSLTGFIFGVPSRSDVEAAQPMKIAVILSLRNGVSFRKYLLLRVTRVGQ